MGRSVWLILLLIPVLCLTAWSQSSTPPTGGSTICFSESEWTAFEIEVQSELDRSVAEAVAAALAPKAIEIERLRLQRAVLLGTTTSATVAFLVTLAVLRCLTRPVP